MVERQLPNNRNLYRIAGQKGRQRRNRGNVAGSLQGWRKMPKKKADSYKPRVYTKKQGKHRVFYIEYYIGSKRKFERAHEDKCFCGKPKPNRPCEHLAAAQEMLDGVQVFWDGLWEDHLRGLAG